MQPRSHTLSHFVDGHGAAHFHTVESVQHEPNTAASFFLFAVCTITALLFALTAKNETQVTPNLNSDSALLNGSLAASGVIERPAFDKYQILYALQRHIEEIELSGSAQAFEHDNGLVVSLRSNFLFDYGEAEMNRSGRAIIEALAPFLQKLPGSFRLIQSKNDAPTPYDSYPNKAALAAARETTLAHFFALKDLPIDTIDATRPKASQVSAPLGRTLVQLILSD